VSDASEKPFEATPHRLLRAKREGNVVRSNEPAANLAFAAAWLTVSGLTPAFAAAARAALLSTRATTDVVKACILLISIAMLPLAAAAAAAASAKIVQSGFVAAPIGFKLERLDPLAGLRRILSAETLTHSLRAALAFFCALALMVPLIAAASSAMLDGGVVSRAALSAWQCAGELALVAVAVGSLFSIAEYAAARRSWLRQLRMSFEERKREAREEEGDSIARGRRRSLHRAFVRGGLGRVREAAFVVTNPDHVAVALAYRPPAVAVPQVLVRALDAAALEVRTLARRYDVPIVENVALARALYRDGRAGESIPHEHYVAVAAVVAALFRRGAIRS
jgi:flagellar biosynthesis protein FlhB